MELHKTNKLLNDSALSKFCDNKLIVFCLSQRLDIRSSNKLLFKTYLFVTHEKLVQKATVQKQ